jgi:hypothetical protein
MIPLSLRRGGVSDILRIFFVVIGDSRERAAHRLDWLIVYRVRLLESEAASWSP